MVDRAREATRGEQQRDRLAALGKLSAGPGPRVEQLCGCTRRTAQQLRSAVSEFRKSVSNLDGIRLTDNERSAIEAFELSCCAAASETDVLKASQIQDEIVVVHQHGIDDRWQYASALVESGVQPQPLKLMIDGVRRNVAEPALKPVSA
ncbi:MAG TPA: hypothetical protein VF772_24590, partial [Terriglobales bacterium]